MTAQEPGLTAFRHSLILPASTPYLGKVAAEVNFSDVQGDLLAWLPLRPGRRSSATVLHSSAAYECNAIC